MKLLLFINVTLNKYISSSNAKSSHTTLNKQMNPQKTPPCKQLRIKIKCHVYLNLWLVHTFIEAEMVVHPRMGVELLKRQIYSPPVVVSQVIIRLLSLSRVKRSSSTDQQQQPCSHLPLSVCLCVSVRRAATNSLLSLGDQCSQPTTSPIMAVGVTREAKRTDRPLVSTVYLSCPSSRKPKGYCKSCLNNTLSRWGRFTGKALCQR